MQISKIGLNFYGVPKKTIANAAKNAGKEIEHFGDSTPTGVNALEELEKLEKSKKEEIKEYFPFGNVIVDLKNGDVKTSYPYVGDGANL